MLIEEGLLKNLVRQDNPNINDLQKDFYKRIKKHMKKYYPNYFTFIPIEYNNSELRFEIHIEQDIHKYRLVLETPNFHYGRHMGINVQWCHTPFQLYTD
jgi:hypothetical protein